MSVSNLNTLFEHKLEDISFVELELLDVLEKTCKRGRGRGDRPSVPGPSRRPRVTSIGWSRCSRWSESRRKKEKCEGIEGLVREHEEFVGMDPDQKVLDLFDLTAAQKTEHYEIAVYGNLALIADRLGMDEADDVLHKNLEEMEAVLEKLKDLTDNFEYEQVAAQWDRRGAVDPSRVVFEAP